MQLSKTSYKLLYYSSTIDLHNKQWDLREMTEVFRQRTPKKKNTIERGKSVNLKSVV